MIVLGNGLDLVKSVVKQGCVKDGIQVFILWKLMNVDASH
jgi:hypothetical protein